MRSLEYDIIIGVIRTFFLKHKRILLVSLAVIFVLVLFFLKNKSLFLNTVNYLSREELAYNNEIIGDLVNRDSDGDGVLDWEEGLWDTDPSKKDTNDDGVPDNVEIEKLKKQSGQDGLSPDDGTAENLTQTEQFSREFFSTVAALNEAGAVDQATVDKLGASLADHIQASSLKKVFIMSDLKISEDNSKPTIQNYTDTLESIFIKYTLKASVPDILLESLNDDGDIDVAVLDKLDPIIKSVEGIVNEMLVIKVPSSLAALHLEALNKFQKFKENVAGIKLVELDVIVAISALSQYQKDEEDLLLSLAKFKSVIDQKLNN